MVRDEQRGAWRIRRRNARIEAAQFLWTEETRVSQGRSSDPEDWEAEQIEELLLAPGCESIEPLEIHMVDFHRSPERAARALASRSRPELISLHFGVTGRDAHRWA